MEARRVFTSWPEATIRRALRLVEAAYHRDADDLFGLDRAGIEQAIIDLTLIEASCVDGEFHDYLDAGIVRRVHPLINAARTHCDLTSDTLTRPMR